MSDIQQIKSSGGKEGLKKKNQSKLLQLSTASAHIYTDPRYDLERKVNRIIDPTDPSR